MKLKSLLLTLAVTSLAAFTCQPAQAQNNVWDKPALSAAPATDDELYIFDTSAGTSKNITIGYLFTGPALSAPTLTGALTTTGTVTQTSASATAFSSGPNGSTNPVFQLVNNVSSAATGISITGRAAAAGADITVLSSGTNENLVINAKGSGTISLNPTATGNVVIGRTLTTSSLITQASASATAFESGPNGGTNPVFRLVNNVSSAATGVSITGRAAGAGADITVLSSGTNENLVINAKGSGTISLNPTATGSVIASKLLFTDLTEVVAATNVITAAESGSVFYLNHATEFVSTLPAPAAGLHYTFIVTGAPSGASYTVVTNSSSNIIKGNQNSVAGDAGDSGTADDTITFVDGQSVAGDKVEVFCDGTSWFAYAVSRVAAGVTFTQAD